MKVAVLLVLAFVAFALAATPTNPTWPKAFSASVLVSNDGNPPHFLRLFRDVTQNQSRTDGFEQYFPNQPPVLVVRFINGTAKVENHVVRNGDQVNCFQRELRYGLVNPDFSKFTYGGQVLFGWFNTVANRWTNANATAGTFSAYYENAATREPLKFVLVFQDENNRRQEAEWEFFEFDATSQDPDLFTLPWEIGRICYAPRVNTKPINFNHKIQL